MAESDINFNKVSIALTDVRKAHRLIYQYHDRVIKIVQYIQHKLNMPICKGNKLFSWNVSQGDYKDSWANLIIENRWTWDFIYLYLLEFHLGLKEKENIKYSISIIEVSDDGYFRANKANRININTFNPVEESSSFFLFTFEYAKKDNNLQSIYKKETRRGFLERIIKTISINNKNIEIIENETMFFLGVRYDMSHFHSVESTDHILNDFNLNVKNYAQLQIDLL